MVSLEGPRLGIQERLQLAQAQCGSMPLTTIIGLVRNTSAFVLRHQIRQNIETLVSVHPILSANIDKRLTQKPGWKVYDDPDPFDATFIDNDISIARTVEEIAAEEDRKGQNLDLDNGTLWRVGYYGLDNRQPSLYVAMTICHIVTDGMGALELFRQIMPNAIDRATVSYLGRAPFPPKAEDTIDFFPWPLGGTFGPTAARVQSLPDLFGFEYKHSKLDHLLRATNAWPDSDLHHLLGRGHRDNRVRHIKVGLGDKDGREVQGIKLFYKTLMTGSIHSVLHTAAIVALAATGVRPVNLKRGEQTIENIRTETPMSLRSSELGHPSFGGNYIALESFEVSMETYESVQVGDLTAEYNTHLHSPETNREARRKVGFLRCIPEELPFRRTFGWKMDAHEVTLQPVALTWDRVKGSLKRWKTMRLVETTPKPEPGHKVTPGPTGWERFFTQKARSVDPFRSSLAISNLGVFKTGDIPGLERVWFCHTAMPWGAALSIDVVSINEDKNPAKKDVERLGIMINWVDGIIDTQTVERFRTAFVMAIEQFAYAGNTG